MSEAQNLGLIVPDQYERGEFPLSNTILFGIVCSHDPFGGNAPKIERPSPQDRFVRTIKPRARRRPRSGWAVDSYRGTT